MTNLFSDLEALRLDTTAAAAGAVEVLTHVPVRKPNRHEFFRTHPDPEYSLDTTVFIDREEKETYLVMPGTVRSRSTLLRMYSAVEKSGCNRKTSATVVCASAARGARDEFHLAAIVQNLKTMALGLTSHERMAMA